MELKENHFQGRLEGIRGKGVYEGREFVERENREREIRGRER